MIVVWSYFVDLSFVVEGKQHIFSKENIQKICQEEKILQSGFLQFGLFAKKTIALVDWELLL